MVALVMPVNALVACHEAVNGVPRLKDRQRGAHLAPIDGVVDVPVAAEDVWVGAQ